MSKKKAPAKADKGKGMDLLSDVALLEAAQLKKALKKKQTGNSEASCKWISEDDDSNDDDSDDVSKDDDDDDVDSDADGDNEASDSERTDFDEDANPNLNQNDDEEKEDEEEYVCTSDNYEFSNNDEEYEELYKDVNVRLKDPVHKEEGKGDVEMTDDAHDEKSYEQVEDDAHVTLTATHVTQKTDGPMKSSSVSSDFASQFLNLGNVPPADNEVISMMNAKACHEELSTHTPSLLTVPVTVVPETSTATATTVPPTIPSVTPLPQQSTPTPAPTSFACSSRFLIPIRIRPKDAHFSTRLGYAVQTAPQSYNAEFEKEAQAEKDRYIDLIEKSIKDIIKDENVVLAKSSSQPQSTYEAAASLTEEFYDALVKSYKLNKDLFESYGKAYSLKRNREDKDKDEDPPAGSDQGLKKRKTSKDAKPSKGSKLKKSKSSSSKGTKSQTKSFGKSAQAEESVFESTDTEMPQNQGGDLGNTNDQPNVEAASRDDWFKKPERPPTPDSDWNTTKTIDFRPPRTWISKIAKAKKPPLTFDELISTSINFLAYVMNNLKIENLTQEHLVGPAFNLLK
ncbi:hypothetical protein Tco_1129187 [Tanacetum coccineum]